MSRLDTNRLGPFVRDSATSREAAIANYPRSGTQRRRVYDAICGAGATGLTRDEIAAALGVADSAADPRVLELKADGFIVETERTRKTRRGLDARILVAAHVDFEDPQEALW